MLAVREKLGKAALVVARFSSRKWTFQVASFRAFIAPIAKLVSAATGTSTLHLMTKQSPNYKYWPCSNKMFSDL